MARQPPFALGSAAALMEAAARRTPTEVEAALGRYRHGEIVEAARAAAGAALGASRWDTLAYLADFLRDVTASRGEPRIGGERGCDDSGESGEGDGGKGDGGKGDCGEGDGGEGDGGEGGEGDSGEGDGGQGGHAGILGFVVPLVARPAGSASRTLLVFTVSPRPSGDSPP